MEEKNIGNFNFIGEKIIFKRNSQITEKKTIQNIRIGQEKFREELLKELKRCPITQIFDKLFDKGVGLITFTPKKEILISKKLSKENIKRINIEHLQIIDEVPVQGIEEYLTYHRKHIFQK